MSTTEVRECIMQEKNDEELIALYNEGYEEAFKILIERYTDSLGNFSRRFVGISVIPDILQDTFIKAWKNIKNFDSRKASFKTWIFTIARNTVTDFLRKKKSVVFSDLERMEEETPFSDTLVDDAVLPDKVLEKLEDTLFLNTLLDTLSLDYRTIFTLHYQEEMTFEEIGKVLNKPMNTVKSYHRRALLQLQKMVTIPHAPEEEV